MQKIPNGLLENLYNLPLLFLDDLKVLHKFLCTVKISSPVVILMWENKSGAVADTHPFWTWWSLIYTLYSATFPSNVCIIGADHFPDLFSSNVVCVCNHCFWTNQNCRSMMGLTSHLSCFYNAFLFVMFLFLQWQVWQSWVSVRFIYSILLWWNGEMIFSILRWLNGEMLFSILQWWNDEMLFSIFWWWNGEMLFCILWWWNGEMLLCHFSVTKSWNSASNQ